jgi:hypothetical protein
MVVFASTSMNARQPITPRAKMVDASTRKDLLDAFVMLDIIYPQTREHA